jgi:hypothetical protein
MTYDEIYRETGSSNISKATPEWTEKLEKAIELQAQGDGRPLIHIATELVNTDTESAGQWGKCANCGSPYKLRPDWGNMTVCSEECHGEYADYVSSW